MPVIWQVRRYQERRIRGCAYRVQYLVVEFTTNKATRATVVIRVVTNNLWRILAYGLNQLFFQNAPLQLVHV